MNPLITHFADDTGPAAALGISFQAFLIQLATFIIVFLVLRQWAFKPILKMLSARRDMIEQGVTLGEKMRAEEAKFEADMAKRLHDARRRADSLVADADAEVRQKVAGAEEVARKRAEQIIAEAESQIKQASARERKRLEKEVIALVSDVSEAVIQEKVDAHKDALLIEKALKEHQSA